MVEPLISSSSSSTNSSQCYQLERTPQLGVVNLPPSQTQIEKYVSSINSQKQSHGHYLPNEIEDDMAASAVSLEISQSAIALRSFMNQNSCLSSTDTMRANQTSQKKLSEQERQQFTLDSTSHRKDLENSLLFKQKATPRVKGATSYQNYQETVLRDKTNNYQGQSLPLSHNQRNPFEYCGPIKMAGVQAETVPGQQRNKFQPYPEACSSEKRVLLSIVDPNIEPGENFISVLPTCYGTQTNKSGNTGGQSSSRRESGSLEKTPCFGQNKTCLFLPANSLQESNVMGFPLGSPGTDEQNSGLGPSIGKEYRVGCVRQVDVRQRQLYSKVGGLRNRSKPKTTIPKYSQKITMGKKRNLGSSSEDGDGDSPGQECVDMTIEQSIAKESSAFRGSEKYFTQQAVLLEEGVRTTCPIKNPFSQTSRSSMRIQLHKRDFSLPKVDNAKLHQKQTVAKKTQVELPCQELSSHCETEQLTIEKSQNAPSVAPAVMQKKILIEGVDSDETNEGEIDEILQDCLPGVVNNKCLNCAKSNMELFESKQALNRALSLSNMLLDQLNTQSCSSNLSRASFSLKNLTQATQSLQPKHIKVKKMPTMGFNETASSSSLLESQASRQQRKRRSPASYLSKRAEDFQQLRPAQILQQTCSANRLSISNSSGQSQFQGTQKSLNKPNKPNLLQKSAGYRYLRTQAAPASSSTGSNSVSGGERIARKMKMHGVIRDMKKIIR